MVFTSKPLLSPNPLDLFELFLDPRLMHATVLVALSAV